jgi:RND superfamily putative drug exporter
MYRRRRLVLFSWLLALVGAFALSSAFSGDFQADAGVSTVTADVQRLLAEMTTVPHVVGADDPYATTGSVSQDGRVLVAQRLIDLGTQAERPGIDIAVGGQAIQTAESGAIGSEGIGLLAAAVILLPTFGSVVAAGLPIMVAIAGLALSGTGSSPRAWAS